MPRSKPGAVVHPEHTKDVAAAIEHYAAAGGAAAGPLVVCGHSCGATMAALLALGAEALDTPVAGWCGISGLYDMVEYAEQYPDWGPLFFDAVFAESGLKAGSPTVLAREGAGAAGPWLVLHSHGDEYVPTRQSVGWAAEVGAECRVLPAGKHFAPIEALHDSAFTAPLLEFCASLGVGERSI